MRLYDPRTGYRITIKRHRALLFYSARKLVQHHDNRKRYQYWEQFQRVLMDQIRARVEYEAKFAYTGKTDESDRDRANLNIRMRYVGRLPLPTDRDVKIAFYNLLLNAKAPKGWEFAVIDWRNDRRSDRGWRRGAWAGGGSQPDIRGRGSRAGERTDESSVDWTANMIVHAALEDFETLVIGEVEE